MDARKRREIIALVEQIEWLREQLEERGIRSCDEEEIKRKLEELKERVLHVSEEAAEIERQSVVTLARRRVPVLLTTVIIELTVAFIIMPFEKTIAKYATVYAFAPLVSAVCGNHGLQTAAIVIRSIAVGTMENQWKTLLREFSVGLLSGFVVGVFTGMIAFFSTGFVEAILVLISSLAAGMATSGLMGVVIPLLAHKLGFDPAIIAGPGETALQDCASYFTFLGVLTLLMHLR